MRTVWVIGALLVGCQPTPSDPKPGDASSGSTPTSETTTPTPSTGETGTTGADTATDTATADTTDTGTPPSVDLLGLLVQGNDVDFGRFDLAGFHKLGDTPFDVAVTNNMGNAVYDPLNLWYVVQVGSTLYTFDTTTGALLFEHAYTSSPRGLEYDASSNRIVGMLHDADAHFGVFDPSTGGFTEIATLPGAASTNAQSTAIDSVGRRYLWLAWYDTYDDRVTLLDLDSGATLSEVTVGNEAYNGLAYDDWTDRWLLAHYDGVVHQLAEVDPSTGTISYVGAEAPAGNSATFDAPTRAFASDCPTGGICSIDADSGLPLGAISTAATAYGYVFER